MKFSPDERAELTTPTGGRFQVQTLTQADEFCRKLAHAHYENFPVGSVFIPKRLRRHFYSVYAFARIADDIADEFGASIDERCAALDRFEQLLTDAEQNTGNPVFTSLYATMHKCGIPAVPLQRLLVAFRMDSEFHAPRSVADLERYCSFSANPIGELVLRIYGLYTAERAPYSDAICTGLQLVNFWQDISRDRQHNPASHKHYRVWLPDDILVKYGLSAEQFVVSEHRFADRINAKKLNACLHELFDITASYLERGIFLLSSLPDARLRIELAFTIAGGMRILHKTRLLGAKIVDERPVLGFVDTAALCLQTLWILGRSFTQRANNKIER
jgi:squalene synthase HpnC